MAISNGMCLTRFAHLDLKFPIFLLQYACCDFLSQYAYWDLCAVCIILRCNIDCFLLNQKDFQKDLESMSILHKKFCNMHIARRNMHIAHRNMHIAIESILPLTYVLHPSGGCKEGSTPYACAYYRPIRFFFFFFSSQICLCRFCTSRRFFGYSAMKNQFYFLYPKINPLRWIY